MKRKTFITDLWKGLVMLAVFAVLYFSLPSLLGFRICVVLSGSMEPNLPTGSIAIIKTHFDYDAIQVGDIVTYEHPYMRIPVVHRVIAAEDGRLLTKGDNVATDDGILLTEDDIIGVYLWHVPYVGYIPMAVKSPIGLTVIAAAVVFLFVSGWREAGKADAETKKPEDKPPSG